MIFRVQPPNCLMEPWSICSSQATHKAKSNCWVWSICEAWHNSYTVTTANHTLSPSWMPLSIESSPAGSVTLKQACCSLLQFWNSVIFVLAVTSYGRLILMVYDGIKSKPRLMWNIVKLFKRFSSIDLTIPLAAHSTRWINGSLQDPSYRHTYRDTRPLGAGWHEAAGPTI